MLDNYEWLLFQIYLHNIIRAPSVRILRPFLGLGFILLSVMCSLARYGLNYNYWTDSLAGFVVGVIFAVYIVRAHQCHDT